MSYQEWYNLHQLHRTYHPSEFDGLTCPRCGIEVTIVLIVPRVGRARWCKVCKILFDKDGVLHDVLAWYDKEYLNGLD